MDQAIRGHCAELNRCNQRGGRMLSILDLLDAQTLDPELAARLMAGIARGASFLVGARPGGAGKTTVMCALLNFGPADCRLVAATPAAVRAAIPGGPRRCYVCHEIGAGPYFGYLWGAPLQAYCALTGDGHILAANLHADTVEEARHQVCVENRVPPERFNAFHYAIFLRMRGGYGNVRRWIDKVYVSDGRAGHALLYSSGGGFDPAAPAGPWSEPEWVAQCRACLETAYASGVRSIEETRVAAVRFLQSRDMESGG